MALRSSFGQILRITPDLPGNILNSAAPVEIDTPSESGIEISKVNLPVSNSTVEGATFTVRNLSASSLVAYSIDVQLFWDIDPQTPFHMRLTEDASLLHYFLLSSGGAKDGLIRSSVSPTKAMRLVRVVVRPDYVEFADGTVYETNKEVGVKLAASRKVEAALQKTYAAQLQAGMSPDDVARQMRVEIQNVHPGDTYRRITLTRLLDAYKYTGAKEWADRLLKQK